MIRTIAFVSLFAATAAFGDEDEEEESIEVPGAEIRFTIEAEHEYVTDACEARLDVSYYQKDSSVHVETELHNDQCGASSGSYALEVRYRGDDGEVRTVEFEELWQRSDAEPVTLEKDYYVAENVDVTRVRSRRLRCECASAPDDAGAE